MHDSRIAKYGVHCPTREEANELLEFLDKKGYTWGNGDSLLDYTQWGLNADSTYYEIYNREVSCNWILLCDSIQLEHTIPVISFAQYKANGFKFEGVNSENEGVKGYESLRKELDEAFYRASEGKGHERHANGKPFDQQPIIGLNDILNSLDGALFQIMKKCAEIQNIKDPERKLKEMDDVIVYGAATKILIRKLYANNTGNNSDSNGTDKAGV